MEIIFYEFTKRANSTRQPTGNGYHRDVQLKTPTSVIAPTVTIKGYYPTWNYAYIAEWGRYYFVTNCTIIGLTTEYQLAVDVLGTYKGAIESYSNRYDRTPFKNENVIENAYSINPNTIVTAKTRNLFELSRAYLVDITSPNGGGGNPSTKTLICSTADLKLIMSKLFDSTTYGGDTLDLITQTVADPMQYIRGIRFCPFLPTDEREVIQSPIKIGWVDVDFQRPFYSLKDDAYAHSFSISFDGYTNTREAIDSTLTSYTLYLVGHGAINIPNEIAVKGFTVDITVSLDTGDTFTVLSSDNEPFKVLNGKLMSPVSLTGVATSLAGNTIPNIPKMIAGGVRDKQTLVTTAKTFIGGLFDGVKQGVESVGKQFIESYKEKSAFEIGTTGSIAEFENPTLHRENHCIAKLVKESHTYVSQPRNLIGYHNDYVGTPTDEGYYRAITCNVNPTCMASERDDLCRLMQEGFYFE